MGTLGPATPISGALIFWSNLGAPKRAPFACNLSLMLFWPITSQLRGPRGPSRFLIGLLTLTVLWGPVSELSISVKNNLVRAFLYLFLDPARWLPAGGRCAIFPPPPSPSRSLSPPLLSLSFTLGWGWGGSLVVSKNRPPLGYF